MAARELGKLERAPVRKVWPLEANFTAWLAENMGLLSEAVGMKLELVQEETSLPGNLRVDILAKDVDSGESVVIENQMEDSDNDHLAGLLHYASHSDSRILILVAGEITHWYRRTMDWLNDGKGLQIYGVEMSAWRNGYAIERRLDLVTGPSQQTEWLGYEYPAEKRKYLDFFRPLVAKLWEKGIADRNVAQPINDQVFPGSHPGIEYHAGFWGGPSASVYLWIATGDRDYNKWVFDRLHEQKAEVESKLGEQPLWERMHHQRMSAVIVSRHGSIDDPPETLHEIRDWMLISLLKLKAAIQPRLERVMGELQSDEVSS